MARVNLADADKYTGGNSKFFKLEDGDSKKVRILYNSVNEMSNSALSVHELQDQTSKRYATVDCARSEGDPIEMCPYCSRGLKPVMRIVLPLYNIEDKEIQYWKKSGSFANETLLPQLENVEQSGGSIAGQTFIFGRKGKTMQDTKYSVSVDLSTPNDRKTKDDFGTVEDPFTLNMIRPSNFDWESYVNGDSNNKDQNQNIPQATRRTADVF